jgi:hypothetical protein
VAHNSQPPIERALGRMTAISVALLLALGGLSLGGIAISKTANVGQCINDNLGDRNAPSAADAAAHIEFAKALDKVLSAPPGPDQKAAVAEFRQVTDDYSATLQKNQQYRDTHPLGRC